MKGERRNYTQPQAAYRSAWILTAREKGMNTEVGWLYSARFFGGYWAVLGLAAACAFFHQLAKLASCDAMIFPPSCQRRLFSCLLCPDQVFQSFVLPSRGGFQVGCFLYVAKSPIRI
jgi:hypothetical protein